MPVSFGSHRPPLDRSPVRSRPHLAALILAGLTAAGCNEEGSRELSGDDAGLADILDATPADVDGGRSDSGDASAADDGGRTDAGPACADDGPLVITYVEEFSGGYAANCMPVVPPDPTRLSLDYIELANPGPSVEGLRVERVSILRAETLENLQDVELDPFVPYPTRLDRGVSWASLVTKVSGSEVGEAFCSRCGDEVLLEMEFESASDGCFRERVAIGTLQCAF